MVEGKRKHKAEEGKEDDKKTVKRARMIEDFFHDKPE
jgi:F0F1-type ATP synthase beta subunit